MEKLLEEWQKRLGLTDWVISLYEDCEPGDFSDQAVGETEFTESCKCAVVRILDPKYYGERVKPYDGEKTLVHELLHLKLSLVAYQVSDLQERYMHQIIDDLARALVDAKRQGKKNDD